jgi:hypothetical protein
MREISSDCAGLPARSRGFASAKAGETPAVPVWRVRGNDALLLIPHPPIPKLMVAKGPLMLSVSDLVLSMPPSMAPKKKSVR